MAHIRSLFFGGPLSEIGDKTLEAFQKERPSVIIWNITNGCNLLCKHCYVGADFHKAEKELTHEEAMDLVDQIGAAQVPLLFITGGEPLMRPDVWDILAKAQSYGIKLALSTNAVLIDDEAADKLLKYGVDYVGISLYGPEEFHDEYVLVPGTYKRVVAAIKRLQDRGIKVGIKTTVNAATFPNFFKLIDVAKELGATLIYPCDLISSGRAVDLHNQRIGKAQWQQIADYMLDDVINNPNGIEYDIGALPSIAVYLAERVAEKGLSNEKAINRLKIKSACPVGKGLMGINSEGNILPCSFVQDFNVGNIRELGVQGGIKKLFEIGKTPVTGKCGDCKYTDMCRGCRVKAYHNANDIMGEDLTCMLEKDGCGC